jgi:hypothetical protein
MNNTARRCLIVFALLPAIAAGCGATTPPAQSNSQVSVVFVEPEKFTDARRAELESTSSAVLRQLEAFLIDEGARYLPANMNLAIRILDIDLAGDFELFRGPQADHVRITRGLYPPRIALDFSLYDADGRTIKEGRRNLTDPDYQLRAAYPREDYLRYEKELLHDWLRRELGALDKNGRTSLQQDQL